MTELRLILATLALLLAMFSGAGVQAQSSEPKNQVFPQVRFQHVPLRILQ